MSIIIDRLFTKPNVPSGFRQDEQFYNAMVRRRYINVRNFIPAVITMTIMRLINLPTNSVIFMGIVAYTVATYYNIQENQKKLKFLNNIIFNDYEQPFDTESYLEMDPSIIEFYYKNKWYIDYNLTAYRKSLEATNNLLRLEYNLKDNLMRQPEQLYRNAYMEYKEALNSLHSSIYKMVSHRVNDDVFNDNLTTLQKLLKEHIKNIQQDVIKCGYNLYNINIWSIINPTNIECEDDTKTKGYSPHYSFF